MGTPCTVHEFCYSHVFWDTIYLSFVHVYWKTLYLSFPVLEVRISLVSMRLCLYGNNNCEHSDQKEGKQHRYTEKELLVLQHAAPRLGLEQ